MARELRAHEPFPGDTVFVYFTAKWCKPCQTITPVFHQLAHASQHAFVTVDVETHPHLCDTFRVNCVPTVVVLNNSTEVKRISVCEATLRSLVAEYA